MPNIYIIIITAVFFAFCTASLVYQAIYSVYFRKRIAIPHDFSEGIMTGVTYPLLWVMYGLIAVQFLSFIVFRTSDEIILATRLMLFAISVIVFASFKVLTPSLLAYWFGKSAFWDGKGESGKNPYSDIYCVKVHKKKSSRFINNQQLYKITFYVKGKTFLLIPKKHVCKMTAKQISVLTPFVDFKECKKPSPSKKAIVYSVCLPVLLFLIISCCFMQTVASGMLNSNKYASSNDKLSKPSEKQITTISQITDVVTNGERLYVFYGEIGAINAYDTDGKFLFSISLPHSIFKSNDIAFKDGELIYKNGDKIIRYTSGGEFKSNEAYKNEYKSIFDNESVEINGRKIKYGDFGVTLGDTKIVSRPTYLTLFNAGFIWPINLILIVCLFALRQYVIIDNKN